MSHTLVRAIVLLLLLVPHFETDSSYPHGGSTWSPFCTAQGVKVDDDGEGGGGGENTSCNPNDISFDSSCGRSIPIVSVEFEEGDGIASLSANHYINATMSVVGCSGLEDNSPATSNSGNNNNDTKNDTNACTFFSPIHIKYRGQTSLNFPKKQFSVTTLDEDGDQDDVPLLGLPKEHKWVINGPYSDKTLIRNVLAFELARSTQQYASRHVFVELYVKKQYFGVYVIFEKIKRDKNRVAIKKDDKSGKVRGSGYLMSIDKVKDDDTDPFINTAHGVKLALLYPKDSSTKQQEYVKDFLDDMESRLNDAVKEDADTVAKMVAGNYKYRGDGNNTTPDDGGPSGGEDSDSGSADREERTDNAFVDLIDMDSFVSYFLVQEISKNVDGFRLSAYMSIDKNWDNDHLVPRLHMGPVWDFNIAFGNAHYYGGAETSDWQVARVYNHVFWWYDLCHTVAFREALVLKWRELRRSIWSPENLHAMIERIVQSISREAIDRNFVKWKIKKHVWPEPNTYDTYDDEIEHLQKWVCDRSEWMDDHIQTMDIYHQPLWLTILYWTGLVGAVCLVSLAGFMLGLVAKRAVMRKDRLSEPLLSELLSVGDSGYRDVGGDGDSDGSDDDNRDGLLGEYAMQELVPRVDDGDGSDYDD